jgi:hypothetical protein
MCAFLDGWLTGFPAYPFERLWLPVLSLPAEKEIMTRINVLE